MFGKNGIAGLMQQAQKMQEKMQEEQEALAHLEVEGQAGAGMVRVSMTCKHVVRRVHIDEKLVDEDREMLEDLITAAFNDVLRKAEQTIQEKMGALTSGLNLPPGFKMPF